MTNLSGELPVSIYFTWEWWEEYYQRDHGRPDCIDFDWLDEHYLGRQRMLYKHFGQFGSGSEEPVPDKKFLSMILPMHTVIIPAILGMKPIVKAVGGYHWESFSKEQMKKLKPVDIADTPIAELLAHEWDKRLERYGTVSQMIDLASVTNNAFLLRGPDLYLDLMIEKEFAHHYLHAVHETMCMAYRFIHDMFGPLNGLTLANCNVVMMSPDLYVEMIKDYDARFIEYSAEVTGTSPSCFLHHCDVKTEPFAKAYRDLPGVHTLQGSYMSDISRIHEVWPEVKFSAMISPVDLMNKSESELFDDIDKCVATGANDLAIWNIDPQYGPDRLRGLFSELEDVAKKHNRKPVLGITTFSWEELDWEFPQYRS